MIGCQPIGNRGNYSSSFSSVRHSHGTYRLRTTTGKKGERCCGSGTAAMAELAVHFCSLLNPASFLTGQTDLNFFNGFLLIQTGWWRSKGMMTTPGPSLKN